MRPLPAETLHDPIEAGPYRMALGLTTVSESEWFEFDALYHGEMAEKRRLLAEQPTDVFAVTPGIEAACAEALASIVAALTAYRSDWFSLDGPILTNRLTGEIWNTGAEHPLELAGRLVQEDLCLIQNTPDGPVFSAASLCFPSRWRLSEKIGRPLAAVHGPVPQYADRLAAPVDRFMRHLRPGRIAARLNWSVVDDPALFQPGGKWRTARNDAITAANAGENLFLRVERQTLRLLPTSATVLFGIRVHVYPLDLIAPDRLAVALRALPEDIATYKSLPSFRTALLAWLDNKMGASE
ncbi:MAG: DUF3445 domain-containing protein [Rhodospirillales bacterium]